MKQQSLPPGHAYLCIAVSAAEKRQRAQATAGNFVWPMVLNARVYVAADRDSVGIRLSS